MFIDINELPAPINLQADICIVGAGAAGIALAAEFADSSLNIILLEAGSLHLDGNNQNLYQGSNTGLPYFELHEARLRLFGGTTNHWTGWCTPLTPIDFEKRDWIPHSGWPIQYAELLPYYDRASRFFGLEENWSSTDIWQSINAQPPIEIDNKRLDYRFWKIAQNPHIRPAYHYMETFKSQDNLAIYLNANAIALNTNKYGTLVTSIDFQSLDGKKGAVTAKRYVLATGGIENARLLLNSMQGDQKGLGNQHGLVGRFFMEHPHLDSVGFVLSDAAMAKGLQSLLTVRHTQPTFGRSPVLPGFAVNAERQRSQKIANGALLIQYDKRLPQPDSGIEAVQAIKEDLKQREMPHYFLERIGHILADFGDTSEFLAGKVLNGDDYEPAFIKAPVLHVMGEQTPNPASRVTLGSEKDALGVPRVQLNWQLSSIDKQSLRVIAETVALELGRLNLGRVHIDSWLLHADNVWSKSLTGGWHHMGTTRMSVSNKEGVVDSNCKLHDVDNLYLAGSSVFTTSGYANPTLTIAALAMRLADHLKLSFNKDS